MDGRPIVVVDDDPLVLDAIATSLTLQGYVVLTAQNGREALTRVEAQRPSLVLMDLHMPVLDGWGFASELHLRGYDPPLVVMSHSADACTAARALGACGYLNKPFDVTQLLPLVEELRIP